MIKEENFICIQGWMRTKLNLKGNELLVYSIIYGFSQAENHKFTGSLQYLADWCGATKQGVLKNLKSLLDKKLIEKNEIYNNGVKFVEYYTTELNTVLNKVEQGIQQSLINNKEEKKEENKENTNSKELVQNFNFGKQKPKKQNLFSKCVSLIDSYDFANQTNIRNLLVEYLQFRISVKDKPLYTNMWKGMLNKLCELADDDTLLYERIIKQSIEKGYLSFYPIKQFSNVSKPWEEGVRSSRYTEKELEELEELNRQREEAGMRTRF